MLPRTIILFEISIFLKRIMTQNHSSYPLIPDQAFLFFPKEAEIAQCKNGQTHRIMFDGGIRYTQVEYKKISQLQIDINKKQKNDSIKNYPENILLRFLQANQFNNVNCIKSLRQYKLWQEKNHPFNLTPQVESLLKEGILYMSGRDYCYRPILVVNVGKILELKPKEKLFLETLGYFFTFVIENCLIEGQIENWVSIIDLGNASVFSLGGTLVDTITFLSSNFRARVHRSYLINAPSSIKFVWGMVKGALTEDQLKKLSLSSKKQLGESDFEEINKSQVERKYGGTKQNILNFWPMAPSEQNFTTAKSKEFSLISMEEYSKKFKNNELSHRKINNKYIKAKGHGLFGSQTAQSKKFRESVFSQRSGNSGCNQMTRSHVSVAEELEQLNMRIPKQRQPPQIPMIPESFSFKEFIDSIVKKIFQ